VLAAAATALFGWLGQPNAAVIPYTITNATATFSTIPNPPPNPGVVDTIAGSFGFDAATSTESNVALILTGGLDAGRYATVLPSVTQNNSTIDASVTPSAGFEVDVTVVFEEPLDGTSTVDPISRVFIMGHADDPCASRRQSLCTTLSDDGIGGVSGGAKTVLTSPPPTATPEPSSLAIFGPASVLCVILWGVNQRRMTRRSPELHEAPPGSEHAAGGNLTA
jgi:hypothetical protein